MSVPDECYSTNVPCTLINLDIYDFITITAGTISFSGVNKNNTRLWEQF
jgi:hypothetical protein